MTAPRTGYACHYCDVIERPPFPMSAGEWATWITGYHKHHPSREHGTEDGAEQRELFAEDAHEPR